MKKEKFVRKYIVFSVDDKYYAFTRNAENEQDYKKNLESGSINSGSGFLKDVVWNEEGGVKEIGNYDAIRVFDGPYIPYSPYVNVIKTYMVEGLIWNKRCYIVSHSIDRLVQAIDKEREEFLKKAGECILSIGTRKDESE